MKPCPKKQSLTARFNTPLIIEQPILTPDGGGGTINSWGFVAKVWAQIETQSAKEVEYDGHLVMKRVHDITMRPQKLLNATMRFREGERHYYITGYYMTTADKNPHALRCRCEEFDGYQGGKGRKEAVFNVSKNQ